MHDHFRCAKRIRDAALDLIGNRVGLADARRPVDPYGHFGDDDARRAGARPNVANLRYLRNAFDDPTHVGGIEASLIDQDGDRLAEDLVTVPRDDDGDQEWEDGVERPEAEAREQERSERE